MDAAGPVPMCFCPTSFCCCFSFVLPGTNLDTVASQDDTYADTFVPVRKAQSVLVLGLFNVVVGGAVSHMVFDLRTNGRWGLHFGLTA